MQALLDVPRVRTKSRKSCGAGTETAHAVPAAEDADARDVQLAAQGCREAFDRLVLKHQDAVLHAASYLLSNLDDAMDAAQETFLKAYRGIRRFRGSSTFRTWVLRIAVNSARSLRTRQKALKRGGGAPSVPQRPAWTRLDPFSADPAAQDIADPCEASGPARLLERKEVKTALERAIAGLDDSDREVIVLRDLSGVSYEAIANALDLPLGTVKSRVHRARLILREQMAEYL